MQGLSHHDILNHKNKGTFGKLSVGHFLGPNSSSIFMPFEYALIDRMSFGTQVVLLDIPV
jgi:hypothetical protein